MPSEVRLFNEYSRTFVSKSYSKITHFKMHTIGNWRMICCSQGRAGCCGLLLSGLKMAFQHFEVALWVTGTGKYSTNMSHQIKLELRQMSIIIFLVVSSVLKLRIAIVQTYILFPKCLFGSLCFLDLRYLKSSYFRTSLALSIWCKCSSIVHEFCFTSVLRTVDSFDQAFLYFDHNFNWNVYC